MSTSDRVVDALVLAAVWLAAIVVLRGLLWWLFARYERRLAERDPGVAARRRTTFAFLVRVAVALAVLIGIWSVLRVFPATSEVANAFLASSAVLAVIAGVALSTPIGNLGSGVLLAFTQPVRLGDRISVGEHTGVVETISLTYTSLVTDEGRHVFVPNQMMVSNVLVNRSVGDPRRVLSVRLPVAIGASLEDACRIAREAAQAVDGVDRVALDVNVGEVTEKTAWLEVVGFAERGADVRTLSSGIRARALAALANAQLLPT